MVVMLLAKRGQQDPTDSAYALWSIWVKQSTIKTLTMCCERCTSSNQSVIEDSDEVYGTTISQMVMLEEGSDS